MHSCNVAIFHNAVRIIVEDADVPLPALRDLGGLQEEQPSSRRMRSKMARVCEAAQVTVFPSCQLTSKLQNSDLGKDKTAVTILGKFLGLNSEDSEFR